MRKKIKNFIMLKGVEIFTDSVPVSVLRAVLPGVDHIKLLNGLNTAARIIALD
jgi:hypothetical protein